MLERMEASIGVQENLLMRNFQKVIDIAMIACENNGHEISYDFAEVSKIIEEDVITNEEFDIFQNAGYMGVYGGLDVEDIHDRKGLTARQKILDYMGSTELIANLFRISQTEDKLRKDKVEGAEAATNVHHSVGKKLEVLLRKSVELKKSKTTKNRYKNS